MNERLAYKAVDSKVEAILLFLAEQCDEASMRYYGCGDIAAYGTMVCALAISAESKKIENSATLEDVYDIAEKDHKESDPSDPGNREGGEALREAHTLSATIMKMCKEMA